MSGRRISVEAPVIDWNPAWRGRTGNLNRLTGHQLEMSHWLAVFLPPLEQVALKAVKKPLSRQFGMVFNDI